MFGARGDHCDVSGRTSMADDALSAPSPAPGARLGRSCPFALGYGAATAKVQPSDRKFPRRRPTGGAARHSASGAAARPGWRVAIGRRFGTPARVGGADFARTPARRARVSRRRGGRRRRVPPSSSSRRDASRRMSARSSSRSTSGRSPASGPQPLPTARAADPRRAGPGRRRRRTGARSPDPLDQARAGAHLDPAPPLGRPVRPADVQASHDRVGQPPATYASTAAARVSAPRSLTGPVRPSGSRPRMSRKPTGAPSGPAAVAPAA